MLGRTSRSHHSRKRLSLCLSMALLGSVWVTGCREDAPDDVIRSENTTESLVFVKTRAEETLNRSSAESNLYILSPISPDGEVTPLTDFVGASVSDPCVSFDGERVLFSMRAPGERDRNIWEINVDGTGLRRVTSGGGPDFDPLYLPDGRIMFTSSRDGEMDEYNHSPAEHLCVANLDGTGMERISFNQSDDFDPTLLPDGRILYTRWEHFGTMNRFPLFASNPDGTGTFHSFGPHGRNFFHAVPTPDGRVIAIESTRINEDAGPIAILKPEQGPADPAPNNDIHWQALTANVNTTGAPWPYGAFKYPHPIGSNLYVASYTLPAVNEGEVDYGLYTFSLRQEGEGTPEDPAMIYIEDLTFLFNDPEWNEFDAQIIAPREKPPVIPSVVDHSKDFGVFLAQDVFNRGASDGQEKPLRGVDPISEIAVIAGRPTMRGERNDFSANEFEKRSLLGFAPVYADGSFKIKVPADTPISFATLDEHDRGFVVKRTWLYVRPGETFDQCVGCHEDREAGEPEATNPNPMAANQPASDLNIAPSERRIINFENDIGPIVEAKCVSCHSPQLIPVETEDEIPDDVTMLAKQLIETPPAGNLDLRMELPEVIEEGMNRNFPIAYLNLSGESMEEFGGSEGNVVTPAFPRRSKLVDYVMALGERTGLGEHPTGSNRLTWEEQQLFNLWVLLGAQYK
ncbi:MAG: hypothetical protein HKN21_07110 [Candidatus Eisenbacteria bacterium]|uniref:Hydrazine synthase alpha subunit middle domain-containing protein n=1 Tax=Eiseniibacteriota bacterium TaxID=2212470 RepID=A0A7Y2E798_UNCEI|nr:hypothetical protein [Candidatus Eisenbacteria bacterium]